MKLIPLNRHTVKHSINMKTWEETMWIVGWCEIPLSNTDWFYKLKKKSLN